MYSSVFIGTAGGLLSKQGFFDTGGAATCLSSSAPTEASTAGVTRPQRSFCRRNSSEDVLVAGALPALGGTPFALELLLPAGGPISKRLPRRLGARLCGQLSPAQPQDLEEVELVGPWASDWVFSAPSFVH